MEINYELTLEDFANFHLFHRSRRRENKKKMLYMRLFIPIAAVFIYIAYYRVNTTPNPYLIGALVALLSTGWVLLYRKIYLANMKKGILREIAKKEPKENTGRYKVDLQKDKIVIKADALSTTIKLSNITEVIDRDGYLFVYTTSKSALIIPPASFAGETARKEFIEKTAPTS